MIHVMVCQTSEFDLRGFLKHCSPLYRLTECGDIDGEEIRVEAALRWLGKKKPVAACYGIFNRGYPLDEYIQFCSLDESWKNCESSIPDDPEKAALIEKAQKGGWSQEDELWSAVLNGGSDDVYFLIEPNQLQLAISIGFVSNYHGSLYVGKCSWGTLGMPHIESDMKAFLRPFLRQEK